MYRTRFDRCPRDGGDLYATDEDPLFGQTLAGRYGIADVIGEGGMGRVYLAYHSKMNRPFAVKVLIGEMGARPEMRKRFTREAEAAARLSHPNLVSVVDFGETETGLLFMVMEYLEGEDLEEIVEHDGPMDPARCIRITAGLLKGLRHAHEQGLIHRDLKLANVRLVPGQEGEVAKILDFGIALISDAQPERLTRAGSIVGTPAFMAPEQAFGESVDPRSDLFSLGAVMYHLLAGRGPFEGSAIEIIQQHMTADLPPIRERCPQAKVPAALEAFVTRLMEREAVNRYENAQAALEALEALDLKANAPRPPKAPAPKRLRGWALALGAALLGGAAVLAYQRTETAPSDSAGPIDEARTFGMDHPNRLQRQAQKTEIEPAPPPKSTTTKPKRTRRATKRTRPKRKRKQDAMLRMKSKPQVRGAVDLPSVQAQYDRVERLIRRIRETKGNVAASPLSARLLLIGRPDSLRAARHLDRKHQQLRTLERDAKRALRD